MPVLLVAALLAARPAAAAVCTAADVCAPGANPCSISGTRDVAAGCHLDFGARHVVLTGALQAETSGGSFQVSAGSLTLTAGKIRSVGPTGAAGGSVTVNVAGAFRMAGSGPTLDVSGATNGGVVTVEAGSIEVTSGSIQADGTGTEACGGVVTLRARSGPLVIDAPIRATGNYLCAGGYVELSGDRVELRSTLLVTGGDFPGGVFVTANAGDLLLAATGAIRANGEQIDFEDGGDGGAIALLAESGDVTLLGDVETNGATPEGEAGSIVVVAGGTAQLAGLLSAQGNGGGSNGGTIEIDATGDVAIANHVRVNGGTAGAGGEIDVRSDGDVSVAAGKTVQANGGYFGGGSITVRDARAISMAGTMEARASSGGNAGFVTLESCSATVAGPLDVSASGGGASGANSVTAGVISVTAAGRMLATPCALPAFGGACNLLTVSGGAPSIDPLAILSPLGLVTVDLTYNACCGNGTLEPGETCDDANGLSCDGCSRFCRDEPSPPCPSDGNECTADCTPDADCVYRPRTGEACSEDGDACTTDVCSATGECRHPARTCNDGIACTEDACAPGVGCVATPDDARCDDDETCTTERCDASAGCLVENAPDGTECSDGDYCTTEDACVGGACTAQGPPLACDDGNACTTDECLPAIGCRNRESETGCDCGPSEAPLPDGTVCADGNDCTRDDLCAGGVCQPGPSCTDDGNACTGEMCLPFADGSELCLSLDNACVTSCAGRPDGTPCSDGSACTEGTCGGGICVAATLPCGDGDRCTGADYCHPTLGCRSGSPPSADPLCEGPPSTLDVFTCYRAATSRGAPRFAPVLGAGVADPWGSAAADLRKPESLCFPTDLSGTAPGAPAHPDKLAGYQMRIRTGAPSGAPRVSIPVSNAFGSVYVDLKRAEAALLPTAVGLASPVPSAASGPGDFACYKVAVTPGTEKFVPIERVAIRDALGSLTVDLRRPTRLCGPLDLNGADPGAPGRSDRLLCYQAKSSTGTARFVRQGGLSASNALGTERLDVLKLEEVCLPSR